MALFSKQNKEVFTNPLNVDNPILGQVSSVLWFSWWLWLLL